MVRKIITIGFLSLFISIAAQEDTIQQWVDKLSDDDLATRDHAQIKLIEIGEEALPFLEKVLNADDLEAKTRAQFIIEQIKRNLQIARSYSGPTLVSITVDDEKVSAVFDELQKQTKININTDEIQEHLDKEVGFKSENAPLFKVLDEISRILDISYVLTANGIKFKSDRCVNYPSAYTEAFKLKITRIERYQVTDFQGKKTYLALEFAPEYEQVIKSILGTPAIRVKGILDQDGDELKVTNESIVLGVRQQANPLIPDIMQVQQPGQSQTFKFECQSQVTNIKEIECEVDYYIGLEPKEVLVENNSQPIDVESLNITLEKGKGLKGFVGGRVQIVLQQGGGVRQIGDDNALDLVINTKDPENSWILKNADKIVDRDSVVVIDKDGKEHKCEAIFNHDDMQRQFIVNVQGMAVSSDGARYTLKSEIKPDDIKSVKFRLTPLYKKTVGFKFTDLKLP